MREVWEKNDPISYLSSSGSVDDIDLKTNRSWDYLRARVGVRDGKVLCGDGVSDLFDKMVKFTCFFKLCFKFYLKLTVPFSCD